MASIFPTSAFQVSTKKLILKTRADLHANFALSKSSGRAILMSYGGCLIALAMAVPSTLFGGIAKATDWQATDFGRAPNKEEVSLVLPLCLQYLTPQVRKTCMHIDHA